VLAAACGGGNGGGGGKCTPGQSTACVGPGACQGYQVCAANGTFGTCMCGGGTAGTTGGGGTTGAGGSAGASGTGGSVVGTGGSGGAAGTTGSGGAGGSAGGSTGTGGGAAGRGGSGGGTGGTSGTGGASAGTGGSAGRGGGGGSAGGGGGSAGTGGAGTGGSAGSGGTGGTSVNCDPVAQTGCTTGQRCTWVYTTTTTGHPACLADGTVNVGGACTYGAAGEATGFDNCKKGSSCVNNVCETDCTASPDSCATNYACVVYMGAPFNLDGMQNYGFCEPTCDPLTQKRSTDNAAACGSPNPAAPTRGCFGQPDSKFTCMDIVSTTNTNGVVVAPPLQLNTCAPGYEPLLLQSTGSNNIICVALCKPADTSSASPGMAAGQTGSGYTCPDKGAGPPSECRYWWSLEYFTTAPDSYGNTLGYCMNYPNYKYDSNNDTVPDTVYPSCTTLSPTAHNFDTTLSDAQIFGCMAYP